MHVARLARDVAGVSAIEFALVIPMLVTLFVGLAELSHAFDNRRKLTLLARVVSDLTSQGDTQNPIAPTLMSDILASSKLVLQPFDSSTVKIVVSTLGVDLIKYGLKPYVCSSVSSGSATARTVGVAADLAMPAGFQTQGGRYVLSEVSMAYKPMLGATFAKFIPAASRGFSWTVSMPWPTRGGQPYGTNIYTEVVLPGGSACPS